MAIVAYNIYVLPTILSVAQLERPPKHVLDKEAVAVRRVAPGPGNWCSPADMHHGTDLGLATPLRPLAASCTAAMLRVHAYEAKGNDGIKWEEMANEFAAARRRCRRDGRLVRCGDCLDQHISTVTLAVVEEHARCGVHVHAARAALGGGVTGPFTEQQDKIVRKNTQKWLVRRILSRDGYCAEQRLRGRLERWRLAGPAGRIARRVLRQLGVLKRLVPPRLRAATLSTILNRWTTDRRMRHLRGQQGPCVLGCSHTAHDSVEHYFYCPVFREWATSRLGTTAARCSLAHGLLAVNMTDQQLQVQAVKTYVLYRAVNQVRRRAFDTAEDRTRASRAIMEQLVHEAVRDDARLRRACRQFPQVAGGRSRRRDLDDEGGRRVARRLR